MLIGQTTTALAGYKVGGLEKTVGECQTGRWSQSGVRCGRVHSESQGLTTISLGIAAEIKHISYVYKEV